MTDREMIEKMEKDLQNDINTPMYNYYYLATKLQPKGWVKIPEDSVVLTKGAYESISSKAKANVVNAVEIRKETVSEILDRVDYESGGQTKQITDLLRKQYGVEIKENKYE